MAFRFRKPHQPTSATRKRKTQPYKDWERLDLQMKEKPMVPGEVMRLQGLLLAGRQLG